MYGVAESPVPGINENILKLTLSQFYPVACWTPTFKSTFPIKIVNTYNTQQRKQLEIKYAVNCKPHTFTYTL